jgi:branched-chain amino acid transport system ATP-binding protein
MLAIGRALMAHPKFLMLDEPSMGLAPIIIAELFEKIVEISKNYKVPILVVEQNAKMVMKISQYSYVIENGKISMQGESSKIINDSRIVAAYLGKLASNQ